MRDTMLDRIRLNPIRQLAIMAAAFGMAFGHGAPRIVAKRHKRPHWDKPHQGAQEMARRRRQIEKGMLTVSNGLVLT